MQLAILTEPCALQLDICLAQRRRRRFAGGRNRITIASPKRLKR
jgi:hypothetical protein